MCERRLACVCPWGTHRIYMHPESERFILNPLIESGVVVGDVNEMKSLSLIEPRRGGDVARRRESCWRLQECVSECLCHLTLRGSWNTSSRTRTTWCLSPRSTVDSWSCAPHPPRSSSPRVSSTSDPEWSSTLLLV